jgi:hypothetical protein
MRFQVKKKIEIGKIRIIKRFAFFPITENIETEDLKCFKSGQTAWLETIYWISQDMIILKIYLTGVIAGLLFPVLDGLFNRYSKYYRDMELSTNVNYIKAYREGPVISKLIAAFLPLLNFVWVFTILMMLQWLVRHGFFRLKRKFICWLASTSPKRLFIAKVWFIKRFFPSYLKWYYDCIEKYHGDKINDTLLKALVNALAEKLKQDLENILEKPESNEQIK